MIQKSVIFSQWVLPAIFAVADVVWWHTADRRLVPLRHPKPWRGLLAAFMGMNILYVVLTLAHVHFLRRSDGTIPVIVPAIAYLWHLLVLPLALIGLLVSFLIKQIHCWTHVWRTNPATAAASELNAAGKQHAAEICFQGFGDRPASAAPLLERVDPASESDDRPACSTDAEVMTLEPATTCDNPPRSNAFSSATRQTRTTRRQMLAMAAMSVPPLAATATSLGSVSTLYGRRLRRFNLHVPQLPPQLDGMTIAHVSDTHIGKFLHHGRLPVIAHDINRLDADFVVFTGDLIDIAMEDLPHGIAFLRSLKSRCGMVVCEGNHDVMQDRDGFEEQMRSSGLPFLNGSQLTHEYSARNGGASFPVQFLGTPWVASDAEMPMSINALRPMIRNDAFPILLAHHPHFFDPAGLADIPLVLSGHTHGGQIMLNDHFGAGSFRFRYISGLYQRGGSNLIVNNGLGNWFPLRINAPAELVHITLRSISTNQPLQE